MTRKTQKQQPLPSTYPPPSDQLYCPHCRGRHDKTHAGIVACRDVLALALDAALRERDEARRHLQEAIDHGTKGYQLAERVSNPR